MDEIIKLVTPENFAIVVAVFLLVKFERTLDRNTSVMVCLLQFFSSLNGKLKKALEDALVAKGEDHDKAA